MLNTTSVRTNSSSSADKGNGNGHHPEGDLPAVTLVLGSRPVLARPASELTRWSGSLADMAISIALVGAAAAVGADRSRVQHSR